MSGTSTVSKLRTLSRTKEIDYRRAPAAVLLSASAGRFCNSEISCLTVEAFGQVCELQSAWIIPRQTSSNSQAERGLLSEAGGVHENHPCGVCIII